MNLNNMRNVKMPNAGPAGALARFAVIGGLGLYGAVNSLYNVGGGHRAIVFNRIVGLKDKVYPEGSHFMIPWFDRPVIYDVRARPNIVESTSGRSRALQMNRIISRWSSNNTLIRDVDRAFFVDPREQDILLTDIKEENLLHEIAEEFKVGFLSPATKNDISWPISGFLYGPYSRPVVNLIFGRREKLVNVFCILNTGSPYTYISLATVQALGIEDGFSSSVKVVMHGLPMSAYVSPRDKHFPDMNLIGSDFMRRANILLSIDYGKDLVELKPRHLAS